MQFSEVVPCGGDASCQRPPQFRLRDVSIIVVGQGMVAERLVRRRCEAGGRVCWLWTQEMPAGPVQAWSTGDGSLEAQQAGLVVNGERALDLPTFVWNPQEVQRGGDPAFQRLRKAFNSVVLSWRTTGPHLVSLQHNEVYKIAICGHGQSLGIEVVDASQPDMPPRWAISGVVIFANMDAVPRAAVEACLDTASADQADVAVHNEEAKPFATINPWHVTIWVPVYFLEYLLYYWLMGVYEPGMQPGSAPWWRGSFTAFIIGPVGYAAIPDFMGVALTGMQMRGRLPRLAAGATYFLGQVGAATIPLGWHHGEWCTLPIFMSVSVAFGPYLSIWAPLHVYLTRGAPSNQQYSGKVPWRAHCLWLLWMVFGTFGTWAVLYAVALAFIAISKQSDFLASLMLPMLTSAVELCTVSGTVQLYSWLVFDPRIRAAGREGNGPTMLGDQRELLVMPISFTHAYAEGTRLVSIITSTVTHPSWRWVAQLLACFLSNVVMRSTLGTEILMRALPSWCQCIFAPDAGTVLHNEAKLCFGYPRFISLLALAVANLILRGWAHWPLFNMHATLLVPCAILLELLEDAIVTSRLALSLGWRQRMVPFYRDKNPLGISQIMGFDKGMKKSTGPAINFSGMRFVRFRLVVVAVAGSSFFPYCLLTLLLGAGFLHGLCPEPIGEGHRLLDGLVWITPLRC